LGAPIVALIESVPTKTPQVVSKPPSPLTCKPYPHVREGLYLPNRGSNCDEARVEGQAVSSLVIAALRGVHVAVARVKVRSVSPRRYTNNELTSVAQFTPTAETVKAIVALDASTDRIKCLNETNVNRVKVRLARIGAAALGLYGSGRKCNAKLREAVLIEIRSPHLFGVQQGFWR
jgi:hypothetical protein